MKPKAPAKPLEEMSDLEAAQAVKHALLNPFICKRCAERAKQVDSGGLCPRCASLWSWGSMYVGSTVTFLPGAITVTSAQFSQHTVSYTFCSSSS